MALETHEMPDGFALEVVGVRLYEIPSAQTVTQITAAWADRGVLVFRRQAISEAELCGFSGCFGELERVVRTDWASQNVPDVGIISSMRNMAGKLIGGLGDGEVQWHSDQSYVANPATGCLLHAVEIPHTGGDTMWANLAWAYAKLPSPLRQAVEGRKGLFSYAKRLAGYGESDQKITAEMRAKTPDVVHDLVQHNPLTGKASMYFDPTTAIGIVGMPDDEAQAVLKEVTEFCTRPEFVYRHKWQVGDVVMWDNAFLLHRREPFDSNQGRLMKRTTLVLSRDTHIVPRGAQAALA
jgi:alpha-ketoglutarate-dependent taurine dioxygenase